MNTSTQIILDNCFSWWESLTQEEQKEIMLEAFAKKHNIEVE